MTTSEMETLLLDVNSRVMSIDVHVIAIEGYVKNVDLRTTRIEEILPTLATKDDLREGLGQLSTRTDQLSTRTDQLSTRTDQLSTRTDQLSTRTDQLSTRIDQLSRRTDQLSDRLEQVSTTLEARIDDARRETRTLFEDVRGDIRMLAEHMAHLFERRDRNE